MVRGLRMNAVSEDFCMKSVKKRYSALIFTILGLLTIQISAQGQNILSPDDQKTVLEFERQAKEYSKLRESLEEKLPKLAKDATADQIETHKAAFQKEVLAARSKAKQGDIFTPAASQLIRNIIKNEFRGNDRLELRKTVFEAETKGVPVKINFAYPDSKEQVEMPPSLLLNLPQLPKQLRYRFVGSNLLLVDRENGLIIDYMTNTLP
jgi:hypothetical protein